MTLKMLPASYILKYLFKGLRSFNTVNMGSVGQRASKLLAVKVGGLKKSLPSGPGHSRTSQPEFDCVRDQIFLKVWQTATLQPFDLQTPYLQNQ